MPIWHFKIAGHTKTSLSPRLDCDFLRILHCMNPTLTNGSGGGTLPLKLYTPERERESDEAEAELAGWLACESAGPPIR